MLKTFLKRCIPLQIRTSLRFIMRRSVWNVLIYCLIAKNIIARKRNRGGAESL